MEEKEDIGCMVKKAVTSAGVAVHDEIVSRVNPVYGVIKLVIFMMLFFTFIVLGMIWFIIVDARKDCIDTVPGKPLIVYIDKPKTKERKRQLEVVSASSSNYIDLSKFVLVETEINNGREYKRYRYSSGSVGQYYTIVKRIRKCND